MVSVINTNHKEHKNLTATVKLLNFDLKVKWEKEEKFTIGEDCYRELFQLPVLDGLTPVYFVKLVLKNTDDKIVSDNFYWFSSARDKSDLTDITRLKKVDLNISKETTWEGDEGVIKVTIRNPDG